MISFNTIRSKITFVAPLLLPGAAASANLTYSTVAAVALDGVSEISAGPSVKLLLNLYRIPPQNVTPTGPHGRLLKGDVLAYINSNGLEPKPFESQPAPPAVSKPTLTPNSLTERLDVKTVPHPSMGEAYIDHELTSMRKTIAKRLTQSKTTIPHAYSIQDISTDKVGSFRKKLAETGVKCSVNDIIIKAVGKALKLHQSVNSLWIGEGCEAQSTCDVSVAVATDIGLITPIIKSADSKSLSQISCEIKELAVRARQGKLQPDEFLGGSFTISNLGMMGITEFSAVINPPQACILAVGTEQLKLNESGSPSRYMTVCLSADRRCVDETQASNFLNELRGLLEDPNTLAL